MNILESYSQISLVLENSTGIRELTVAPENGKIGTLISYHQLTLDTERAPVRYGWTDAIRMGGQETYASAMMTFRLLGKTFGSLLFPATPDERNEAKNMLS